MSLRPGCEARCPGCAHREWTAEASLEQKTQWLRKSLARWADRLEPLRAVHDEARWSYRHKTCLRAEWGKTRWRFGMLIHPDRGRGRSRETELIEIPQCPVHSARIRTIVSSLCRVLPGPEQFPLVYLVISGELVTLVLKAPFPRDGVYPKLDVDFAAMGIKGVFLNYHAAAGDRVLSSKGWVHLWGARRGRMPDPTDHYTCLESQPLEYGPDSFQQLIPELQAEALYEVENFLNPLPDDGVVDLCSGIGTSLRIWGRRGSRALGVELSGEAVECAMSNSGLSVLQGRCGDRLPQIESWLERLPKGGRQVLAFANPPRLGLESRVVEWLAGQPRFRLAYLSCSAGTLARDLAELVAGGARVERLIPLDFFPQTPHVEVLACVSRGELLIEPWRS